jgi:hypothetical protein
MNCLARLPSARESLVCLIKQKENPCALAQGPVYELLFYLLVVGQELEIIFTFFTVNIS